jgi:hypothetical protein
MRTGKNVSNKTRNVNGINASERNMVTRGGRGSLENIGK